MSAFVLKLIAVVSMLIDHAAYSLFLAGVFTGKGYVYMRAVGRIAFPIFAYMIVNGFEKTHDVRRYFSRLALFAVISQPVYRLAFTAANYGAQALTGGGITLSLTAANITAPCLAALIAAAYLIFACRGRVDLSLLWVCAALVLPYVRLEVFGITLLGGKLNVFYTLAIGLALIAALDALRRARGGKGELFRALMLLLAALAAALLLQKDRGLRLDGACAHRSAVPRALAACVSGGRHRAVVRVRIRRHAVELVFRALCHARRRASTALLRAARRAYARVLSCLPCAPWHILCAFFSGFALTLARNRCIFSP